MCESEIDKLHVFTTYLESGVWVVKGRSLTPTYLISLRFDHTIAVTSLSRRKKTILVFIFND